MEGQGDPSRKMGYQIPRGLKEELKGWSSQEAFIRSALQWASAKSRKEIIKHHIQRDACTLLFSAALFMITKRWNKPNVHPRMMDKQNGAHPRKGILLGHKKE